MRFFSQHDLTLVALCLLPALASAVALVRLAAAGARQARRRPVVEPARVAPAAAEPLPETGEIVRAA